MKKYSNYMVDLETMSTQTDAAIISIGAVFMDFKNGCLGSNFYFFVDLKSSVDSGGHIEPDTINWWMKQSDMARKVLFENTVTLRHALLCFTEFVYGKGNSEDVRIWSNGATFDCIILRKALEREKINLPWHFINDMCYRTVVNLNPEIEKDEREGTYHHALDDAKFQARHLIKILKANGKLNG